MFSFGSKVRKLPPSFRFIFEQRTEKFVNRIQETSEDLNKVDTSNRNLLQLAAARGLVEPVLWLLYAGIGVNTFQKRKHSNPFREANKSPLYLAIENKQWLIAQILLICGADKNEAMDQAGENNQIEVLNVLSNLMIDKHVFCAVIYWGILNYHEVYQDHLLQLIQPQILIPNSEKTIMTNSYSKKDQLLTFVETIPTQISKDAIQEELFGLLELAAEQNREDLAFILHEMTGEVRTDASVATFAYWAILNNNQKLFSLIKNNDLHIATTLIQLKNTGEVESLINYYEQASQIQKDLYLNFKEDADEEKLTTNQLNILTAGTFSKDNQLHCLSHGAKTCHEKYNDFLIVLNEAERKKNYVLINNIISEINNHILFSYLLKYFQRDLFFNSMFAFNHYPYDLLKNFQFESLNNLFDHLILEKEGIIYRMLYLGTVDFLHDLRNDKAILLQKNYFQAMKISVDQFVKLYHECLYQRYDIHTVKNVFQVMTNQQIATVIQHAKRFGFHLPNQPYQNIQGLKRHIFQFDSNSINGPAHIILSFLNAKDLAKLACVSREFNQISFSKRLTLINDFLYQLKMEVKQKSFFSHLNIPSERIFEIVSFLLVMGLFVGSTTMLGITNAEQISTRAAMRRGIIYNETNPHSKTLDCSSFLIGRYSNSCDERIDPLKNKNEGFKACYDLCRQLEKNQLTLTLEGLGVGVFGSVFLLLFAILVCQRDALPFWAGVFKNLIKGKDRLYDLPLTEFSPKLQLEATELFHSLSTDLTINSTARVVEQNLKKMHEKIISTSRYFLFHQKTRQNEFKESSSELVLNVIAGKRFARPTR